MGRVGISAALSNVTIQFLAVELNFHADAGDRRFGEVSGNTVVKGPVEVRHG
ncbi:hypothetical protein D3C85_1826220 [compost metagenome]